MLTVQQILDAHGGLITWNKYHRIIATLSFGGLAFKMKFNTNGRRLRRYIISLDSPFVMIENYPKIGQQGIFTPQAVWIESAEGEKINERLQPREVIIKGRHTFFWDDLDMLYFAGYACWNYFNTPFLLAQDAFQCIPLPDWKENGECFRRLLAIFPEEVPAHCKRQTFYFDKENKIRRFDYEPEVFASWAKAAHYCLDYKNFHGISIPTKRRVVPRKKDGKAIPNPTLVWIEIKKIHFQ